MNLKKTLRRITGEIIYRLKPKRASSALTRQQDPLFDAIHPGDLVIDCGANVGIVTDILAKKGAEVHAFEPNPDAFQALSARFSNHPQVHLYPQAAMDKAGQMTLYLHLNYNRDPQRFSQGSSLIAEKRNVNDTTGVDVETIDLATFITELNRPVKLLKLDVEGSEYAILNRLIETNAIENIEKVIVETHARSIPSLKAADKALREQIQKLGLESKIDLDWI